jgi:hypothetical protein
MLTPISPDIAPLNILSVAVLKVWFTGKRRSKRCVSQLRLSCRTTCKSNKLNEPDAYGSVTGFQVPIEDTTSKTADRCAVCSVSYTTRLRVYSIFGCEQRHRKD